MYCTCTTILGLMIASEITGLEGLMQAVILIGMNVNVAQWCRPKRYDEILCDGRQHASATTTSVGHVKESRAVLAPVNHSCACPQGAPGQPDRLNWNG